MYLLFAYRFTVAVRFQSPIDLARNNPQFFIVGTHKLLR
jgi:hypothetical protein